MICNAKYAIRYLGTYLWYDVHFKQGMPLSPKILCSIYHPKADVPTYVLDVRYGPMNAKQYLQSSMKKHVGIAYDG